MRVAGATGGLGCFWCAFTTFGGGAGNPPEGCCALTAIHAYTPATAVITTANVIPTTVRTVLIRAAFPVEVKGLIH